MANGGDILIKIAVIGAAEAAAEADGVTVSLDRLGVASETTARKAGSGGLLGALTSLKSLFVGMGVVEAGRQFINFQSQMERLRTQTGATQGEVSRMSSSLLGMATSVATGPNSLAQALYHIESAGFRGKAALDALRLAAEGAKVGGADLTDTTTGLTAVLVAGFRGVSTLREAMGALNATVGAGDMTFQDLNDALSTGILATAKIFGLQVKDIGAALATLGDNNIRGAQAATRLRMSLSLLAAPSKAAAKELASIGLNANQLGEDMRKPNGLLLALEDLKRHLELSGLDPSQQAALLSRAFGGGRSSSAILTLLGQMDRLRQKYHQVGDGQKSFQKDWETTTKTLGFFVDQLKALGEVVLIRVGAALVPIAHGIQSFVGGLEHGKTWAEALAVALGLLAVEFFGVTVATTAWSVAMTVLDAIPVVAVIAAIALGVVMLIKHFGAVKAAVVDAFHWVLNAISNVWNWIKKHWPLLLEILMGPFTLLLAGVAAIFHTTVPKIIEGFIGWVGGVFKSAAKVLVWPFEQFWHFVKTVVHWVVSAVEWMVSHVEKLLGKILGPIGKVLGFAGKIGGGILHAGSSIIGDIGGVLGFADGGTTPYGGPFVVGERGPELVYLPGGSHVVPNHEMPSNVEQRPLEATIPLAVYLDGRQLSRSVVRQGLIATARRGAGGPTIADAGG